MTAPAQPVQGVEAVSVKPLKWSEVPTAGVAKWQAESNFGFYAVHANRDNSWSFNPPQLFGGKNGFHSPKKAMAAAQADYEARIRSALIASPAPAPEAPAMAALRLYNLYAAMPAGTKKREAYADFTSAKRAALATQADATKGDA